MRKIDIKHDVLPHVLAVALFLLITVFFFSPVFFENKTISQYDIQESSGMAKELADYRAATGEEGLWAGNTFSGMPAYLVNIKWSNGALMAIEGLFTAFLPHPINKIFAAMLSFYIMLLAFRVRPSVSIAGAIAFALSTYVIIGLSVGHNGRIGAIAFMPLVVAGIHLAFTGKRILGFSVTAMGLAFHLRENHLQITYYLLIIVAAYGVMQLVTAIREKQLPEFAKTLALLVVAGIIGLGTFFGQFWAISEYTKYSIRGKSELQVPGAAPATDGLSKGYAFAYNYGIWEPMTLLVPKFYGGSSSVGLAQDQNSATYKALVQAAQSGDEKNANQLVNYTSAYWGPQDGVPGPYYAGAIIIFLFVAGILFADKKYVWWLVPLGIFSVMISWGDAFSSFNYFLFDHLPGYNKFRSFSFGLIILLFVMPLLGFIGLEKLLQTGINKETKKKLIIAFSATGGLCLLLILFAGMGSYVKDTESRLPIWFLNAMAEDRKGLMQGDAFRSLCFIFLVFIVLFLDLPKKLSLNGFFALLIALVIIDMTMVDRRYFNKSNFQRKTQQAFVPNPADEEILKDKEYFRVLDLTADPLRDARPSYFHNSLGGYHGAKMRRYQDLYDSAVMPDLQKLNGDLQAQKASFENYNVLSLLNTRYLILGPAADNILRNPNANGPAWFIKEVKSVNSANEELNEITKVNLKDVAVIDATKFKAGDRSFEGGTVKLVDHKPPYLKYESESVNKGLIVFSEIYYPKGWNATIDGKDSPILRADYVLRALEVPAGKHTIEFTFKPAPYKIGNKITMASSWLLLLVVLGSIGWSLRKDNA